MLLVVDERHPQALGDDLDVERPVVPDSTGRRHAHLALTQPFGLAFQPVRAANSDGSARSEVRSIARPYPGASTTDRGPTDSVTSDGARGLEQTTRALTEPTLIAAFAGWNDAGDAATLAVRHLIEQWRAEPMASIDPEEYYDFQATRPQVRLADGHTRRISWPANEAFAASTPGGDVVLLLGVEPQLRWRTFTHQVAGIAEECGVNVVVTLGALLADVAHRRPVSLIGTATDQALIDRFDLQRSRYEGPTGIVGVLHDTCHGLGVKSLSLWAAVPAYASQVPSPKAALALGEGACRVVGTPCPGHALGRGRRGVRGQHRQLPRTGRRSRGLRAPARTRRGRPRGRRHHR